VDKVSGTRSYVLVYYAAREARGIFAGN